MCTRLGPKWKVFEYNIKCSPQDRVINSTVQNHLHVIYGNKDAYIFLVHHNRSYTTVHGFHPLFCIIEVNGKCYERIAFYDSESFKNDICGEFFRERIGGVLKWPSYSKTKKDQLLLRSL